jgi:hypothetical protein
VSSRRPSVPLGELPSACPSVDYRASTRADPFWAGLWPQVSGGVGVSWTSRSSAVRLQQAGLAALSRDARRWSPDEAVDLLLDCRRQQRLSALAAIAMWRTVSVEQLVAITGYARLAPPRSHDRALMWAAGLVQRGTLVLDGRSKQPGSTDRLRLYRPDLHRGSFERLTRRLSYPEWVGVTGGSGWTQGPQFDRHNLLAVELCLRVAEWCDIGAVLGESLATWKTMLHPSAKVPATSRRAADAAWVRPDGLVVAVEMTSQVSSHSKEKAQAWADVLAQDESRATMVLFVEAAHPDRRESGHNVHMLRRHVAAAARSTMDHVLADVPSRMAVARWVDWFPAPGMVDPSVVPLLVWRPTGAGEAVWEPANLLDSLDVPIYEKPARSGDNRQAVLDNLGLLYGVPGWLVKRPVPSLDNVVRARAGFPPAKLGWERTPPPQPPPMKGRKMAGSSTGTSPAQAASCASSSVSLAASNRTSSSVAGSVNSAR